MKRLKEESVAPHAETIHYSASAGLRVESDEGRKTKDSGVWPLVLEGLADVWLRKEEADRIERQVREVTGWSDLIEEKTGFVEAACQNYEVLVEDKRAGKAGGAGPPTGTTPRAGRRRMTRVLPVRRKG